jgi:hypothetical protein
MRKDQLDVDKIARELDSTLRMLSFEKRVTKASRHFFDALIGRPIRNDIGNDSELIFRIFAKVHEIHLFLANLAFLGNLVTFIIMDTCYYNFF